MQDLWQTRAGKRTYERIDATARDASHRADLRSHWRSRRGDLSLLERVIGAEQGMQSESTSAARFDPSVGSTRVAEAAVSGSHSVRHVCVAGRGDASSRELNTDRPPGGDRIDG